MSRLLFAVFLFVPAGPLVAETARKDEAPPIRKAMPVATERVGPDALRLRKERDEGRHVTGDRRMALIALGNRIKDPAVIDTLRDLGPEEKDLVRRRYHILHPLD